MAHGTEATGKTLVTKSILTVTGIFAAVVKSQECITPRHLLERTAMAVSTALEAHNNMQSPSLLSDGKCENMSTFVLQLQHLLKDQPRFLLVVDGIDRQREASPGLIPAIARLGEVVSKAISIKSTFRFLSWPNRCLDHKSHSCPYYDLSISLSHACFRRASCLFPGL